MISVATASSCSVISSQAYGVGDTVWVTDTLEKCAVASSLQFDSECGGAVACHRKHVLYSSGIAYVTLRRHDMHVMPLMAGGLPTTKTQACSVPRIRSSSWATSTRSEPCLPGSWDRAAAGLCCWAADLTEGGVRLPRRAMCSRATSLCMVALLQRVLCQRR